ncbi:MAG: hypothetical protein L0331_26485, partial [Chloroflexi bacterium]|nr:hypothetical protein [Chloroflexota bacterium]
MKTIAGLYDDLSDAYRAIQELIANEIARDDISLVAGDVNNQYSFYLEQRDMRGPDVGDEAEGALAGGVIGGLTGLLLGLGALTIPGIGPIVAAGPLMAALTGATVGGLAGAIINWGVPEEEAQLYGEAVRRGG